MGTGGGPFYEVISQKIFNLTNDGFPYDDSGGGEGDDGFEYNDVIAAPTSIRPPETKKRPPKKPSRQGTPAPPRSPPSRSLEMHQTRARGDKSQIYLNLKAGYESQGEGKMTPKQHIFATSRSNVPTP